MWARLDDAILDNPKIIAAGPLGFALHVAAITWCARNLTDGFIPKRRVAQLLDLSSIQVSEATGGRVRHGVTPADVAADLARIGLWHDQGASWEVHDFLDYNLSRAEQQERSTKITTRVQRWRAKRRCNAVTNTVTNAVTNALETQPPGPVPGSGEDLLSFASLTHGAAGPAPCPTALGFDRFWSAYPKKRHKPAALRAWTATDAARHLEPILAGVARWQASDAWRRGFIEDPATFLRQQQWQDELPLTGEERAVAESIAILKAEHAGQQP